MIVMKFSMQKVLGAINGRSQVSFLENLPKKNYRAKLIGHPRTHYLMQNHKEHIGKSCIVSNLLFL